MSPNGRSSQSYRSRAFQPLPSESGLHLLGSHFRLAYTARHGQQLLQCVDDYIRLTEVAAPIRKHAYKLREAARTFRRTGETEWERALWDEYRASARPTPTLLPGVCGPVLSYQTMLRNTNRDAGWGEVDLLGVDPVTLRPVVIEVKDARGTHTPLRGIVECAAYGLALRRVWRTGRLRQDWRDALAAQLDPGIGERFRDMPAGLDKITVVVAAPEQYWERRIGDPNRRTNGRVPPEAWRIVRELIAQLGQRGIRVVPARLHAGGTVKGRPQHIRAGLQPLPYERILELGADGGSITVHGWPERDDWRWFRVNANREVMSQLG
jgi:hypothetical protein